MLIVEAPENGTVTGAARISVRGRVEGEGAQALLVNGRPVVLQGMRFEAEVDAVEELRFEVRDGEGRTLASDRRGIEDRSKEIWQLLTLETWFRRARRPSSAGGGRDSAGDSGETVVE